jgi:hypothetical protein
MESVVALPTRSDLRRFVRQLLCDYDRLDAGQFPFFEAPITRSGRLCGLLYELQGPRLMCSRAIWVCDEHRILFYDSTGARFADISLSDGPDALAMQSEYDRTKSQPIPVLATVSDRALLAADEKEAVPSVNA